MDSRALLIQQQFQDLNAADQLVQVVREQQGGTTYQKWTFVDTDRHTYHLGLRQRGNPGNFPGFVVHQPDDLWRAWS